MRTLGPVRSLRARCKSHKAGHCILQPIAYQLTGPTSEVGPVFVPFGGIGDKFRCLAFESHLLKTLGLIWL